MDSKDFFEIIKKLDEKLGANSFYNTYASDVAPIIENAKEKAKEATDYGKMLLKTIKERMGEYVKYAKMFEELTSVAKKYNCTIIVPTQPDAERSFQIPEEWRDRPDIFIIDYDNKLK